MMEEEIIQGAYIQVKCSRPSFFFFSNFFFLSSSLGCPSSHCNQCCTSKRERARQAWGRVKATIACNPFLSTWLMLPLCELGGLQASLGWALGRLVFFKLAYGLGNWFSEGLKNKNCKSDIRSVLVLCLSALGCLWETSNAFISETLGNKTV